MIIKYPIKIIYTVDEELHHDGVVRIRIMAYPENKIPAGLNYNIRKSYFRYPMIDQIFDDMKTRFKEAIEKENDL